MVQATESPRLGAMTELPFHTHSAHAISSAPDHSSPPDSGCPVVVCGKVPEIAKGVAAMLHPHYEGTSPYRPIASGSNCRQIVIHVVLSPAVGAEELPFLFEGKNPPPREHPNHGSQRYDRPPEAIIMGAGYDDKAFNEIREACAGQSNIPWLRVDMSVEMPPYGPAFGQKIVSRMKERLSWLREEGKFKKDGVYWY